MTAKSQGNAKIVVNGAKDLAREAKASPWFDRMARLGYFTRGLLYGLIGCLAIQVIFNGHGELTNREGVLSTIAAQPFGKLMLVIAVVGMLGMLMWGIIRAIADPYHKGDGAKGVLARTGYLFSGISYGALVVPTVQLITGNGYQVNASNETAQQAAAGILMTPWGAWLVGVIGGILIVVGILNILQGVRDRLEERFKSYQMSARQQRWAKRMGRIGRVARGVVFIITGFLVILAAVTLDPQKISGIDGALAFLASRPYGPWLLALVALGLIAYAIYSIMGALWFRIKEQ